MTVRPAEAQPVGSLAGCVKQSTPMSASFDKLPASDSKQLYNVVVDAPRGSRNKYKYDHKLHIWRLAKLLPLGATFPFDFGFIPSTKGGDGDPLDVLVLTEAPSFVGCVLPVQLIGLLESEQTDNKKKVRNDRLLGVIHTKRNPPTLRSIDQLIEAQIAEIEHFFVSYNEIEGRTFEVLARKGPEEAEQLVQAALTG
jgi:inorganic pyrophosphatase